MTSSLKTESRNKARDSLFRILGGILCSFLPGVEVLCLFLSQNIDIDAHRFQFQAGNFSIDRFRYGINLVFKLVSILDNIFGATLSVRAVRKLAQIALLLDQHVQHKSAE